ncbi:MAG TPA: Rieske 2Fe-2S domain-containing protein [Candidatus Bathyarchaeia archaeon]|nr:Rieske 2Fe-2S domain-containing protein [Candidatus Bathyarchaeia archaeon]
MDDKKPSASTTSTPPPSATQQSAPPPAAAPVKGPLISRRRFLQGALAASTILAAASVGASGQILGPQVPTPLPPQVIGNWYSLNKQYLNVKDTPTINGGLYDESQYSQFFYWPYDSSVSPYYKNVLARLPDTDPSGKPLVNPLYPTDPMRSHLVAFNTTCVHLRCLVNPIYSGNPGSGEFRLQCPCHGSQYRLVDAVPVAGPAFDLGLNPLPQVELSVDSSGNISATAMRGTPGIGRT